MRLLISHPSLCRFSCADCQRWVYDFETGERKQYRVGPARTLVDQEREGPPPCRLGHDCPKESPDKESEHVLSDKNSRALTLYLRARAVGLPDFLRDDPIVASNCSVIHEIMRASDNARLSTSITQATAIALTNRR